MDELFEDLFGEVLAPASHSPDPSTIATRAPTDPQQIAALRRIEAVFDGIVDSISNNDKQLSITLKRRDNRVRLRRAADSDASSSTNDVTVTFPGRTPQEAWKFTVLIRILELMHEAIMSGIVTTKRDIYYKDVALFTKQKVVDHYVDEISFTFNVPRSALNVAAAAKGLVAGSICITKDNGQVIDGRQTQEGHLVPDIGMHDTVEISEAKWVLVIEKEAVFHSVITSGSWPRIVQEGIIITGKGYPDLSTRSLCHRLSTMKRSHSDRELPLYALVDWDPDGIGILSIYRHGSASTQQHDNWKLPDIHWLGLTSLDISKEEAHQSHQQLLLLSQRDRRKASKMLEWEMFEEDGVENEWRREVQLMMMLGYKAEIQLLDQLEGGVHEWVAKRLY